ncbi:FNBP1 family protein [Megaselia abdita]
MTLTWGKELWDQYENLSTHTSKGIEFLEKYGGFVKERILIEKDYATKLRRLVKNFQPKKKDEEDFEFTTWRAFRDMLKEITDLAGQRERVAETFEEQIIHGILILAKTLKDERKKCLTDGANLNNSLSNQLASLDRAKRNYEKSFRDSEKAVESYQKADADLNLSRADVERHKITMNSKIQLSDDAKNEYANQLQKTNNLQQQHYDVLMPDVFNRLQELDEKRTRGFREFMKGSADIESSVAPIIASCLQGIVKAADSIDEKDDSHKVIERYQSGFTPPNDIPFEDLSKSLDQSDSSSNTNVNIQNNMLTVKGTMGANKMKKRVGLFGIFGSNKNSLTTDGLKEDYSDLPPTQQRKKLQAKINEIQQKISQESNARDGLMKMKQVYESNPSLGNPMTVEGQLNESEHKLDKLKADMKKYQGYLTKANSIPLGNNSPQANRNLYQNGHRVSRYSNGSGNSAEIENDDSHDDHHEDGGSLSRSDSEDNVAQIENGLNLNNNGYTFVVVTVHLDPPFSFHSIPNLLPN